MADNTTHYGLPFPEGGDGVVVHADIERLAKRIDASMNAIEAGKSFSRLTPDMSLDDLEPGRTYYVLSLGDSEALNLPSTTSRAQRGNLEVFNISASPTNTNNLMIRWTTYGREPGVFIRSKTVGTWYDWERIGETPDINVSNTQAQAMIWGSSTPSLLVPYLADELAPYGVGLVDRARGGQWSSQTVANIGSQDVTIPVVGGVIPASGTVELDRSGSILNGDDTRLGAPENVPLMGWLDGVYGQLEGTSTGIFFHRERPGSPVNVTGSATWVPEIKTPAHFHIWSAGKNDLNVGGTATHLQRVIERKDNFVTWAQDRNTAYLILGHFVNPGTGASEARRTQIEGDNADSEAKYPDNYLDVQALFTSPDVWEWTGISPTQDDLDEQALGNLPPSLSSDGTHLTDTGNQYLAWAITQWAVNHGHIGQGRIPFASQT